jgi:nitrite reductase (NADH) small subunit
MTVLDSSVGAGPAPAAAPPNGGVPAGAVAVCALDDLQPDRGACALVNGHAVAVFRCSPFDEVYAIGNVDPYSGASVLSRGIVGSIGDRPVVASPIYKNRFDLTDGTSLENQDVRVPVHPVWIVDGHVLVGPPLGGP